MTDQEIVDNFAMLITGQASLVPGDPRTAMIIIAQICLQEFVGLTKYAIEHGLVDVSPTNGFEPTFARPEDD